MALTALRPFQHFGADIGLADELEDLDGAIAAAADLAPRRALTYSCDGQRSYRDMRTLGSIDLDGLSLSFGRAYEYVRKYLSDCLDAAVYDVPDSNERYVLNVLDRPFDEQGWHVDTYAYAVNLCWEAPCDGGALELAMPERNLTLKMPAGSWYAIRTDTVPHRVAPLLCGRRIVLNLAYHESPHGEAISYSSASLYQPRSFGATK